MAWELSFLWTFALKSIRSQERSLSGTFVPLIHDTDMRYLLWLYFMLFLYFNDILWLMQNCSIKLCRISYKRCSNYRQTVPWSWYRPVEAKQTDQFNSVHCGNYHLLIASLRRTAVYDHWRMQSTSLWSRLFTLNSHPLCEPEHFGWSLLAQPIYSASYIF